MATEKLVFALFTVIIILINFPQPSISRQNRICKSSSCGNILNISHPFRLKDDPKCGGDRFLELACENNHTFFYFGGGGGLQKYYVQSIDYQQTKFRIGYADVEKDNCSSLPLNSLSYYNFSQSFNYFDLYLEETILVTFISCPYPVDSPMYVSSANCIDGGVYTTTNSSFSVTSSTIHSYAMVDGQVSDVGDLCTIDLQVLTSWPPLQDRNNILSFSDIHDALVYGLDLRWYDFSGGGLPKWTWFFMKYLVEPLVLFCISDLRRLILICIGIVSLLATRFIIGIVCLSVFLIYKWRRRHLSMFDGIENFLRRQNNLMPIRYSYSDVKKITKGFKDKLGEGGYGSVYKGKLRSGRLVAIKVLGKSKANGQEFINEVATIGRIHHVNVVQLIGYCAEGSKRALVYEFMPKGSLEKYIFFKEGNVSLIWERKYEIALGVARGLEYLHRGCDIQILHFDIKPHNILLDDNFIPKISDFGLAKLYPTDNSIVTLTAARGTIGYVAPELINRCIGDISYKADVYSFGMLLIEIVGLKENLMATEEKSSMYFPSWIYDRLNKGNDIVIEDGIDDEKKITRKMTLVALWCIQKNPIDRPSMGKVMEMLEGDVEHLQVPPESSQTLQGTSFVEASFGETSESVALLYNSSSYVSSDVIRV